MFCLFDVDWKLQIYKNDTELKFREQEEKREDLETVDGWSKNYQNH